MINLEPNSQIQIYLNSITVSSNAYFNGILCGSAGNPSKDKIDSDKSMASIVTEKYKVPDNGIVEVVIEIGLNDYGGLSNMPAITLERHDAAYLNYISFLPGIALGLLIFSLVIGLFISFSKIKNEGSYNIFIILLCITIHFIFSYESLQRIRWFGIYGNDMQFQSLSFISLCVLTGFLLYYVDKIKLVKIPKLYLLVSYLIMLISSIVYFFTLATIVPLFLWIIYLLINIPIIYKCFKHIIYNKNTFFIYIYFTVIGMGLLEMLDFTDLVTITTNGFISYYIIVIMCMTFVHYGLRIMDLNKTEKEKQALELEKLTLKQELLMNQIQPHFIHNSLTSIMNLYHKDQDEGDKGIILFSKHLRTYVDSIDEGLISFNDEIDNIINYVELTNLSLEQKFNLILDIIEEDFMIPALSLQPIIENSVKYSCVNEKKDGYIKISSEKENDTITIIVSNNGIPFDVEKIGSKSKGIKNIKARFDISLNAEVSMTSGEITQTIIKFKLTQN